MAEKAEITDISKLAPDLLNKSAAQLEREITERQMALSELKRRDDEKKRQAILAEVGARFDRVLEDLKWLNENDFLSDAVKEFFSGKDRAKNDIFAPHLRMKKPTK